MYIHDQNAQKRTFGGVRLNTFGSAYSDIRRKKKYTQIEVTKDILSRQQLSKFENNLHSINIVSFFELLDRLNITINELLINVDEQKYFHQSTIYYHIAQAILNNNKEKLLTLKSLESDHYHKDPNIRHQHNIIIIDQYCHKMDKEPFDEGLSQVIIDYLFNSEEWTYYELCLYNNCLEFLPLAFVRETIKIASERSEKYIHLQQNKHIQATLYLNMIYVLIKNNELRAASHMIITTKTLLANSTLFFEMNRLVHLEGIYLIKQNYLLSGKQKCLQAIKTLEYFDNLPHLRNHYEELSEFFGKDFTLE